VTRSWEKPFYWSRYVLAIIGGLLLAASFPKAGVAGFAWIAPGIIYAATLGKSAADRLRIGVVAGLAHYLAMLYWLLHIPYQWHGIPLAPALGWLALACFLSLFPATWVWLLGPKWKLRRAKGAPVDPEVSALDHEGAFASTWIGRTAWALWGAALWVALEMLLTRIFGGFPWDLLGVSQYRMIPLIQVASVTGVYGVSFLVVWFSLALVSACGMLIRRPQSRSVWVRELFLPLLVVALCFQFGVRRIREEPEPARSLSITMLQPSIPQTTIWNPDEDENRFQQLLTLCESALSNQTQLLIWPESAVPKLLRYDTNTFEAVTGLARRHGTWFLVGADDAEPAQNPTPRKRVDYFNCSFLINPKGQLVERYKKQSLVIFGEYVPLTRWLPFLGWFTPVESGFTPGTESVSFSLEDLGISTSVLICYEDVFPQLGRSATRPETDFLVNLTNDGWFGEGSAQWQHTATSVFRSIENRVPLLRCTNNGITCWVDRYGRIREVFRDPKGSAYGAGFMLVSLPLPARDQKGQPTFYNRYGDSFGWSCVVLALAGLTSRFKRRKRGAKPDEIRPEKRPENENI
jgi:apolipoprotein N-acyltransferase